MEIAGIGTEVSPSSFANLALRPTDKLATQKTLDLALATSFNQHVIGGYRFLARRWKPGSKIYLFGFSRGAYTARFLNEMLDYVGLISADNEELIPFVWEAFTDWKFSPESHSRRMKAYDCLRLSRETMCRPIDRVYFLGLFDTVNSVAEFEGAANRHGCQPSPVITRHAVSIDERRIKFQPVLFAHEAGIKRRRPIRYEQVEEAYATESEGEDDAPTDLEEVYFAGDHSDVGGGWRPEPKQKEEYPTSHVPLTWMINEAIHAGLTFDQEKLKPLSIRPPSASSSSCSSSSASTSSKPRAQQRQQKQSQSQSQSQPQPQPQLQSSTLPHQLTPLKKAEHSQIHDSLDYDSGKGLTTLFWRLLEYLPFVRPIVQPNGTIRHSRWHRRGQRRPLPQQALVHGSVVRRLRWDPDYRPYNLGLGLKPNMQDKKEEDREIGRWRRVAEDEGGVREYWVRV